MLVMCVQAKYAMKMLLTGDALAFLSFFVNNVNYVCAGKARYGNAPHRRRSFTTAGLHGGRKRERARLPGLRACACTCVHVRVRLCACASACVFVSVRMYVCVCVCVCVYLKRKNIKIIILRRRHCHVGSSTKSCRRTSSGQQHKSLHTKLLR
jgi:hypothetical protein